MEGFFFMAQQYKEKIAAGGELTAQQIANMNHIVVNNYTNAGLSILFRWWCTASSSTASNGSMSATIRCVPTRDSVRAGTGRRREDLVTSLTLMPDSATRIRPTKSALT